MQRRIMIALALCGLVAACAPTTQFTSQWQDPAKSVRAIEKVLVIGVSNTVSSRRQMEALMAQALKAKGVDAVAAYTVMQGTARPERADMERIITEGGYDSAVVVHLRGTQHDEVYHAASKNAIPYHYHGLYGYHSYVWNYVHTTGYYTQTETVYLETSLYDTADGEVMWVTKSTSTDPKSATAILDDISKRVAQKLADAGYI